MKMAWSWDGYEDDKPLERKKRSSSPVSRPHSHGKRNLKQKSQKIKRKERDKNQGVTAIDALSETTWPFYHEDSTKKSSG